MNLEFSLFLCISLEQNTFIVLYEKLIVKFFGIIWHPQLLIINFATLLEVNLIYLLKLDKEFFKKV